MSKRIDVKKLASMAKSAKATPPPIGGKGAQGEERPVKKANGIRDAPLKVSPQKKSPTKRVMRLVKFGIPLLALVVSTDLAVATKLAQFVLLAGMEMVGKMKLDEVAAQFYCAHAQALVLSSSLIGRVREMRERVETRDVAISSLKGERHQGTLRKKQIKLRFPDLSIGNMEIDPDLANEGDGDGEVDGDETLVKDRIPLGNQTSPVEGDKEGA
ncbi:hypothetical protein Acr_28g0005630 [Actinidia rufa]|uniref:Uncharacterized protein n=1 Tax=Actinidia rufa TaxID=165716 RepID=A0A7J0HA15_9ERIC|nr:hypothetical protein Acr_28g0005630 [Actinidia rufa]